MANIFVNLPAPAANAAGAAVDMSAFGPNKTINIIGNGGPFEPTVQIEISNDSGATKWSPVTVTPGQYELVVACHWMRAKVSNYKGGGAPTVEVGGQNIGTVFAELDVPAGDGAGTAVDTTTLPGLKTVQVGGQFKGNLNIEISEDGGATYSEILSFGQPGAQTAQFTAGFMRVSRNGVPTIDPGTPIVNVAATTGSGDESNGTPPFALSTTTIYARLTGSDTQGTGTSTNPYRTFQRAIQDVPRIIDPGAKWIVDISGTTGVSGATPFSETLPANFVLPCWKAAECINTTLDRFWVVEAAVSIQADMQPVGSIPLADTIVAASDIASSVQDPVTQLLTITLNSPRASWAANALKGKQAIDAVGVTANATIWQSTSTTLIVATTALVSPFNIMEPSAVLTGSSSGNFRGALNAINIDSINFNGLKITTNTALGHGLYVQGNGQYTAQLCELNGPEFETADPPFIARFIGCWIYGVPIIRGNFILNQGLMDACTSMQVPKVTGFPQFRRMVFDACSTIEVICQTIQQGTVPGTVPVFRIDNTVVRNVPGATGDGIRFHGVNGQFSRLDVYGCGRDGIRCELGAGLLNLTNVRTTGAANAGNGITVSDGMIVKVDAATSAAASGGNAPLTGTLSGAGMKVGTGAVRTWANFLSGGDGRPVRIEYDITAAAATGATGTGSQLFQ